MMFLMKLLFVCVLCGAPSGILMIEKTFVMKRDAITDLSSCHCKTDEGCVCRGHDDDYKVTVMLIVSHEKSGQDTVIWGHFQVGKEHFVKRFTVRTLRSFCRTNKGTTICFIIHRFVIHGYIHGYIDLAYPREINLGLFTLPIL